MKVTKQALIATLLGSFISIQALADTKVSEVEFLSNKTYKEKGYPFSEGVKVGNTLYLSGQIALSPETGKIVPGGIEAESRQTMDNIKASLERHDYSMTDLVKCTVILTDINEWGTFNKVYKEYFGENFPARSAFAVSALALGAKIEVECIAAK